MREQQTPPRRRARFKGLEKCTCAEVTAPDSFTVAFSFTGHFVAGAACILSGIPLSSTQLCTPALLRQGDWSLQLVLTPALAERRSLCSYQRSSSCTQAASTGCESLDLVFDHHGLTELIVGFASHAEKGAKPSWKPICSRKQSTPAENTTLSASANIYWCKYNCHHRAKPKLCSPSSYDLSSKSLLQLETEKFIIPNHIKPYPNLEKLCLKIAWKHLFTKRVHFKGSLLPNLQIFT